MFNPFTLSMLNQFFFSFIVYSNGEKSKWMLNIYVQKQCAIYFTNFGPIEHYANIYPFIHSFT